MKKLLSILLFIPLALVGQNQIITSISLIPEEPTISDSLFFTVEYLFTSSDCQLDISNYSLDENNIIASTNHCLGMLTAMCNTSETFEISPLSEGTYNFIIYSSLGYGEPTCTPVIIPSDIDSISFVVNPVLDIEEQVYIGKSKLYKMIDVLGREHIIHNEGEILFYIYENGVVEKKFKF